MDMRHIATVTTTCDDCDVPHTYRVTRDMETAIAMDVWDTEPYACSYWVGREYTDAFIMMAPPVITY